MKSREVSNPLNRFREIAVAYDEGEGPPSTKVTLLEDQSRSILSRNDSPDLNFRWSANPYRGCLHACAYCMAGDTPILMGDARTKLLRDLAVGDEIYGTELRGLTRAYTRTRVLAHWSTVQLAYEIELADGTKLTASGDHRFLTERGWKDVAALEGSSDRPHLTTSDSLIGVGQFAAPPLEDTEYMRGYSCGISRGDATSQRGDDRGRDRDRLGCVGEALADPEARARSTRYLATLRNVSPQAPGAAVAWPDEVTESWRKGFLAGMFDARGLCAQHVVRIAHHDPPTIERVMEALAHLGFDAVIERSDRDLKPMVHVRLRQDLAVHLRFFHLTGPAITRTWDIEAHAVAHATDLRVVAIKPLGSRTLYDITTGTEDFIANGVVSHNCYARPTHEYLDLGAGTDFDTKIVVKREAPELLRATFDKPSWQGELVMFSGVTDCYQAIEKDLEITRRCLEVCLEYRNPVSIISKSALVERDIDLFLQLQRDARVHIAVSLAFSDNEMSRAIEPWAASPDRRFRVIERLVKAGLTVSVMLAPIIPGVNDSQMVTVLERAAAAGATSAGWVLLRLPGAAKQVFEDRIRVAMPLAADKILHRIRETRGGEKLSDAAFHTRGRGGGPYADTIAMMFEATTTRLRLHKRDEAQYDDRSTFRRPLASAAQLSLF